MTYGKIKYFEPLHHFIILAAFMAAVGFGMLVAFNKRVAIERERSVAATMIINAPLSYLAQISVRDI